MRLLLILYGISLTVYLTAWYFYPYQVANDTITYFEPAKNLVEKGLYGYADSTGKIVPTAMRTPLIPLMLAGLYALCGDQETTFTLFALITSFVAPVYPLTAWKLGSLINRKTAVVSFCLTLFSSTLLHYASFVLTDFWLGIFINALIWIILLQSNKARPLYYGGMIGAILGMSLLTRPTLMYAYPVVLAGIALSDSLEKAKKIALPMLAAMLLVLSPWILRNYMVFDNLLLTTFKGQSLTWSLGQLVTAEPTLSEEANEAKTHIRNHKDNPGQYANYRGRDYTLHHPVTVDETLEKIARETIFTRPYESARIVWKNLDSILFGTMTTQKYNLSMIEKTGMKENRWANYLATVHVHLTIWLYKIAVPAGLIWLCVVRFRIGILPVLLTGYILGLTSLVSGYDRFRVPVEVVMIWGGSFFLCQLGEQIKRRAFLGRKPGIRITK